MCGPFTHPCHCEHLRACEQCVFFFFSFMGSRSQAASALENTDGEQRAFSNFLTKIPEISVGSQMERSVSVSCDRNIRDHLLIRWDGRRTKYYRYILRKRLISLSSSVDFSYIGGFKKSSFFRENFPFNLSNYISFKISGFWGKCYRGLPHTSRNIHSACMFLQRFPILSYGKYCFQRQFMQMMKVVIPLHVFPCGRFLAHFNDKQLHKIASKG